MHVGMGHGLWAWAWARTGALPWAPCPGPRTTGTAVPERGLTNCTSSAGWAGSSCISFSTGRVWVDRMCIVPKCASYLCPGNVPSPPLLMCAHHTHTHTRTHMLTHMHAHMHMHMHTGMHTHTHTHTSAQPHTSTSDRYCVPYLA